MRCFICRTKTNNKLMCSCYKKYIDTSDRRKHKNDLIFTKNLILNIENTCFIPYFGKDIILKSNNNKEVLLYSELSASLWKGSYKNIWRYLMYLYNYAPKNELIDLTNNFIVNDRGYYIHPLLYFRIIKPKYIFEIYNSMSIKKFHFHIKLNKLEDIIDIRHILLGFNSWHKYPEVAAHVNNEMCESFYYNALLNNYSFRIALSIKNIDIPKEFLTIEERVMLCKSNKKLYSLMKNPKYLSYILDKRLISLRMLKKNEELLLKALSYYSAKHNSHYRKYRNIYCKYWYLFPYKIFKYMNLSILLDDYLKHLDEDDVAIEFITYIEDYPPCVSIYNLSKEQKKKLFNSMPIFYCENAHIENIEELGDLSNANPKILYHLGKNINAHDYELNHIAFILGKLSIISLDKAEEMVEKINKLRITEVIAFAKNENEDDFLFNFFIKRRVNYTMCEFLSLCPFIDKENIAIINYIINKKPIFNKIYALSYIAKNNKDYNSYNVIKILIKYDFYYMDDVLDFIIKYDKIDLWKSFNKDNMLNNSHKKKIIKSDAQKLLIHIAQNISY